MLQPDQVVLSTDLFFKLDVSLPLVTGKLLQNTVDVSRHSSFQQLHSTKEKCLLCLNLCQLQMNGK